MTRKMGLFDEYGEQRAVSRGHANMAEEGQLRAKCNETQVWKCHEEPQCFASSLIKIIKLKS